MECFSRLLCAASPSCVLCRLPGRRVCSSLRRVFKGVAQCMICLFFPSIFSLFLSSGDGEDGLLECCFSSWFDCHFQPSLMYFYASLFNFASSLLLFLSGMSEWNNTTGLVKGAWRWYDGKMKPWKKDSRGRRKKSKRRKIKGDTKRYKPKEIEVRDEALVLQVYINIFLSRSFVHSYCLRPCLT